LGADMVLAVNVDERFDQLEPEHFRKMGSVSKRIVTLQLHHIDQPEIEKACVLIHPDVTGIGLLSTKRKDQIRAIEAGEEAARLALPEIKKCLTDAGIPFGDSDTSETEIVVPVDKM